MAKPSESGKQKSLQVKLGRALKKIEKLEELQAKKEEALKVLDKVPDVKTGIYAATFAGLTYGYKEGIIDLFPRFFFQFGTEAKDPQQELNKSVVKAFEIMGLDWTGLRMFFPSEDLPGDATPKDADAMFRKTIKDLETKRKELSDLLVVVHGEAVETEGRKQIRNEINEINGAIARVRMEWTRYTLSAYLVAMGLAGATMLFLMETSTSEVANVGAKLLDAVTPLT